MKRWAGTILFVLLMGLSLMTTVFASKSLKYDELISYVYIESPELLLGQQQQIGVLLADDVIADTFELVYQSQMSGKTYVLPATEQSDGVIEFSWIPEERVDEYQVIRLNYTDENGRQSLMIRDPNFAFSVKEEISDVVTVDLSHGEDLLSATVQKNIVAEVASGLEKTYLQVEQPILRQNARMKNIVIALDAGHDSSHAGAQANGIVEEIVTLKLAQYAKEELETYEGVTVYMTRTGAACPYPDTIGKASANDINKRIDAAVDAGAQAVISFHLNSYTSSGPKGCLVLCPQGNDSIAVDALGLSARILEKLCAVGFENDGSRQEQWAITSYSKQKGIPGIIIEHGFITNPEDAAKLKDEACVKAMGIADAQGIAEFYGLQKKDAAGIALHVGSGEYYIQSAQNTNMTLDMKNASIQTGTPAYLDEKGTSLGQSFTIKRQTNGYYQILNTNSGMALGISKKSGENNLQIQQSEWTGAEEQLWQFITADEGYCYIRSKLGTYLTRVSDNSPKGCNIVAYELLGLEKQGWKITAYQDNHDEIPFLKHKVHIGKIENRDMVTEGIFTFKPESENLVMTVADASREEHANVELQTDKEKDASQHWTVVKEDHSYRIMNLNSGQALSVDAMDENIKQMAWNAEETQLWDFIEVDSGSYLIRAKSGMYLGYKDGNICLLPDEEKQTWVLYGKAYSIMGESNVTVAQMGAYYNKSHKDSYPSDVLSTGGAPTITEFCQILQEEAEAEGVRVEVAFAQIILETGWLRFTGSIRPEWFNFCGLGAINSNAAGNAAHFSDVREGLRAQIQHLKAYGSTDSLNNECIDPRFSLVKRGSAPYVQWLGAKANPDGYGWATSQEYGNELMKLIHAMERY